MCVVAGLKSGDKIRPLIGQGRANQQPCNSRNLENLQAAPNADKRSIIHDRRDQAEQTVESILSLWSRNNLKPKIRIFLPLFKIAHIMWILRLDFLFNLIFYETSLVAISRPRKPRF